jgi:hypothetical protein
MIIVKLNGGLGNQMFQYALGRQLAHRNNVDVRLDITEFEKYPLRSYRLDNFNIIEKIATKQEIKNLKRENNRYSKFFFDTSERLVPYYKRSVVREQGFNFDPNILRIRKNAYLEGYWQSEKYFRDSEMVIRNEFTLRNPPDAINQRFIDDITRHESVSIHIRRGDYVSDPATNQTHGIIPTEYYQKAIEKIGEEVDNPRYFLFSDDHQWVKDNFPSDDLVTCVTHNSFNSDHEDLRLMSLCNHHIIANSSFSWWGAWLGKNPDKIVYAPKKWFGTDAFNKSTSDLFPQAWKTIEV